VGNIAREGVQNTHHCSGASDDACHNDSIIQLGPLRSQSLFQFVQITDAYFSPSFAIVLTCCNQSDSNLANLEATVEVG